MPDRPFDLVPAPTPAPETLRRRVEELLDRDDASRAVAAIPPQELYTMVAELGLDSDEAHELVGYATPQQLVTCLDLDAWVYGSEGELPEASRIAEWLATVAAAGADKLARVVGALDEELATWLFARLFRIYDPNLDEVPEGGTHAPVESPDGTLFVEPLAEGGLGALSLRLLDVLYRGNADLGRSILLSARTGLASVLEEEALRFRRARLAELGFPDPLEALEVYAYLDPARVRIGEGTAEGLAKSDTGRAGDAHALSLVVTPELEHGFFAEALRRVVDLGERERLQAAVLFLLNRVLVADRARPGDADAMRRAARRVAANVGLGLEAVCKGDAAQGAEALRTIALARLFRAGVSFGIKLRRLVDSLSRAGMLSALPFAGKTPPPTLLADDERALALALAMRPPEVPAGGATGATRPLATLAEVRDTASRIERWGTLARIVWEGLGADRAELVGLGASLSPPLLDLRFGHLVVAAGAHALVGARPLARPVTPTELVKAAARAQEIGGPAALAEARSRLLEALAGKALSGQVVESLVDEHLAPFLAALRGAREPLDLRELGQIAVRRGEALN